MYGPAKCSSSEQRKIALMTSKQLTPLQSNDLGALDLVRERSLCGQGRSSRWSVPEAPSELPKSLRASGAWGRGEGGWEGGRRG